MEKNNEIKLKTINDKEFKLLDSDRKFDKYQPLLTEKLDKHNSEFNQEIINEIVLWKVNRYAKIKEETLVKINSIDFKSETIDEDLTTEILTSLLNTKGIQIAMASTILRFKNPKIYQIIDQRVYRVLYKDKEFPKGDVSEQIKTYLKYLSDLKENVNKKNIPFEKMDRVLYNADKHNNKEIPLKNYGAKAKRINNDEEKEEY